MSDVNHLFLIVLATIGLFVWNRLPLVVVAMGSALALYVTGILALDQVFRGVQRYWRVQVRDALSVMPGAQVIYNPSFNPTMDLPAFKVPGCVLKRLGMVQLRLPAASTTFSNSINLADRRCP